jgi:hypothetical protein
MTGKEILEVRETEDGRKIEIRFKRVVSWALVFTNAFFVSYFLVDCFDGFKVFVYFSNFDKPLNSSVPASFSS